MASYRNDGFDVPRGSGFKDWLLIWAEKVEWAAGRLRARAELATDAEADGWGPLLNTIKRAARDVETVASQAGAVQSPGPFAAKGNAICRALRVLGDAYTRTPEAERPGVWAWLGAALDGIEATITGLSARLAGRDPAAPLPAP